MKTNTWTWIAAVLILLIGMVAGWQLTKAFTPKCPEIKRDTVSIPFDTTAFVAKLKPKIITSYKDTGSIHWKDNIILIPYYKATKADTIQDYQAFHSTFSKKDTLTNDPNLFYEATYNITQNRLISLNGRYFWKLPQTIIQNLPVVQPSSKMFVGLGIGSDFKDKIGLSSRITLLSKKDALYGIEITFIPGQKLIYSAHYDIKIKL